MSTDTSTTPTLPVNSADALVVPGLPPKVSAWLVHAQEPLARALAQAHAAADVTIDDGPALAVETLPEEARRFLWHGIRQHHAGLAELVRDPILGQLRATFGAQLHLSVADLLTVILKVYTAEHERTRKAASARAAATPPSRANPATSTVARAATPRDRRGSRPGTSARGA